MTQTLTRRSLLAAAAVALVGLLTARPAAAQDSFELKIATVAPDKTPWAQLLKDYKGAVEKASKGRIKVRVFLGGTMGDENETVRMTARGEISGVGASTGAVASLVEELMAIEIPFLFNNANEADYVMDKHLLAPMEEAFKKKGLVLVMWSENGFRHFGANFPIKTPGDLKNKKMRSQESFPHIEMWKALEASAEAIPTTEVTTALKTGSVQGFDQALLYTVAGSWQSSITHMTLSAHIYQPAVIAFNKAWFDKLPPDLQAIVIDEGRKIVRTGRAAIRKMNPKLVDIIKKSKVKIDTLSAAERAAFVKKTAGVRDRVKGKSAAVKATVELIEKGLAEYRSKAKK
ncbi:MAG: TRAP transporter substrate-binding protein [Kofleriaceae bacterium]|nr:MAG: TRAP transporter substrate-binding protein [Kofleriaceae bacterium]MBZ0233214.1 TRAP transporter substrate-binding protein DctP [Kofleriaceae bacterium]